jgi:tetratricopeptide (TPR) repeat protein
MSQEWSASEQYSYDRLMVSIDLGLGHLSLLIAVCDDMELRERLMGRCEAELKGLGVGHVVRSLPAKNPSLYGVLRDVVVEKDIVVSVVGVESLLELDIQTTTIREQTELFGYLQWTREALREYAFPVVLWVPSRLVGRLEEKAPDFWSWRSGVFWFGVESKTREVRQLLPQVMAEESVDGELQALLMDIDQLQQDANPDEVLLAELYTKLGDIYTKRVDSRRSRQFAIRVFQSAVNLQKGLDNGRQKLAQNLQKLGDLQFELKNQVDEALENYTQAIGIYREVGARLGEANTLQAIADVLQFKDRRDEALENYTQAIGIYREVGDRLGEANTLQAIADVLQFKKRSDEALENYTQAIGIYREVGDRLGEANTLQAIADVLQFKKRSDEALENYTQAIGIYREVGDRLGEANTLKAIGDLQTDYKLAVEKYFQPAFKIYEEVGSPYSKARILTVSIAPTYLKQGDRDRAISSYEEAMEFWKMITFTPGIEICERRIKEIQEENDPT